MTRRPRGLLSLVGVVAVSVSRAAVAAPADAGDVASPRPASQMPEYCDSYYEGLGVPRDYAKAFACYRRQADWLWVALMQVNGEGTAIDLAAARASLDRLAFKDADALVLERIIKERQAGSARSKRVDFCRDVASTTFSGNMCQAREEGEKARKSDAQLQKIRAGLDPRLHPALERAQAAFTKFVKTEGDRVYQENIDGSIRDQEAMDQQSRVRRYFMATIKLLVTGPAPRLAAPRSFDDADRELNSVYKNNLSAYTTFNERAAKDALGDNEPDMVAEYLSRNADYKAKSRAAQHEWVRYRDAMGKLAAARWPDVRGVEDLARALVTEDRIRELRGK
jgi:hypothetical protein